MDQEDDEKLNGSLTNPAIARVGERLPAVGSSLAIRDPDASRLPSLIIRAGTAAQFAYEEFFHGRLRNPATRKAYGHAVSEFLSWCEERGTTMERIVGWGDLLLDEHGLRSDCVGEACLDHALQDYLDTTNRPTPTEDWYARCRSLYLSRQYERVIRLTGETAAPNDTSAVQLLRNSARIMDAIYGRGVDADWRTVNSAIRDAREWLVSARVSQRDKQRIGDRLTAIDELASSMSKASDLDSRRIVDVLAGLSGKVDATDHKMALILLLLQFESAQAARGHSDAILRSLSMAEQVLRVWAWWQLGLNYYHTPTGHESTWSRASDEWRSQRGGDLTPSNPGEQFPGIASFAYFAVAKFIECGTSASGPVPAATFDELQEQMFVFDWRNDAAHAVAIFDAKNRRKFLAVVDRWLESLCACLPNGSVARQGLLSVIEPLPTFQGDRLVWQ